MILQEIDVYVASVQFPSEVAMVVVLRAHSLLLSSSHKRVGQVSRSEECRLPCKLH